MGDLAEPRAVGADREHVEPDYTSICFPRYRGDDGVEAMCLDAVEQVGVLLLPASVYASELGPVPADRFRIGVGRYGADDALNAFDVFLRSRGGDAATLGPA